MRRSRRDSRRYRFRTLLLRTADHTDDVTKDGKRFLIPVLIGPGSSADHRRPQLAGAGEK
jgi:hypothetical protein